MLSQFHSSYPSGALYCSPRYRTRGHVIPFGLFWIHYREIPVMDAYQRVSAMRATLNAIQLAFAKEGAGTPAPVRADLKAARLEP